MNRIITLIFAGLFAGWILTAAIDHERRVEIMFDPATDGPILPPRTAPVYGGSLMYFGTTCQSVVSINGGAGSMVVLTPCMATTTFASGSGGGSR